MRLVTTVLLASFLGLYTVGCGDRGEAGPRALSLSDAVTLGDVEAARGFLGRPGAEHAPEELTALLTAAAIDANVELAKLLFEYGADPTLLDKTGRRPLWAAVYPSNHLSFEEQAAANRHLEMLRLFAANGAPLDEYVAYAAYLAAPAEVDPECSELERSTTRDAVLLLIELGADVNAAGINGRTALDHARAAGAEELASRLVAVGAAE